MNDSTALPARLGYNGLLHDVRGWQPLGNGRRTYDPALMRFHAPDGLSPFAEGGINAYAYCGCEPVNNVDPSGQRLVPAMLLSVPAIAAVAAGVASGYAKDDALREGLLTLSVVSGLLASAALLASVGARALGGTARKVKYTVTPPQKEVQRNPGGSYLKGQPRQAPEGGVLALKESFSRMQRGAVRKLMDTPRFRYAKAPRPDSMRIRKMKPVERGAAGVRLSCVER